MAVVRTLFTFTLVGALLGNVAAAFFGRAFLPWYNTPGGISSMPAQCACEDLVRSTVISMMHYQLVGMALGAVAFLVLGIFFVRARRARAAPTSPASSTPPPSLPPAGGGAGPSSTSL